MENSDEEYLVSEIKIEEEEFQRAETDDQELTTDSEDATDSVDESFRPNNTKAKAGTPKSTKPEPPPATVKKLPQQVTTKCTMKNCTWSTKDKDKNLVLSRLKFHAKLFHPKIIDICEVCLEMFDVKKKCEQHLCENLAKSDRTVKKKNFDHHLCENFECKLCTLNFESETDFVAHIKSEHNMYDAIHYRQQIKHVADFETEPSDSKLLICKLCNCKFFESEKLFIHSKIFHLVSSDINMDTVNFETPLIKKFVCNTCNSQFTQRSKFKLHYYKIHKEVIPTLIVTYHQSVKYFCHLCPARSRKFNMKKLKQHYLDKHKKQLDFSEFDVSNWCSTFVSELYKEKGIVNFNCSHCSDFYSNEGDLNRHKNEVHGEFCCSRCTMVFDTEKAHKIHVEEVHFGECKFCDFTTFNFIGLHVHVTNKHTKSLDVSDFRTIYKVNAVKGDAYHVCSLCQRCLSSQQNMKMHYYWFHNRFLCDFCKLHFSMSSQESEHFSCNHLTDCIHCNQTFTDFKQLGSHLQGHHLNTNYSICEFCGEDLKNREEVIEHRNKHESDKSHGNQLCSLCGFQCKKKRNLEQHLKMKHANTSQLSEDFCKICQKKFKNITLHMHRTHGAATQEKMTKKQHKCHVCDKVFYKVDRLKKHLTFHSQYKCAQCPMQFNVARNLEQHVSELHTNRYAYSCTVCAKIFSSESDFNLHMKFHRVESKADLLPVLRCELCDKYCLNYDAMLTHVKSRHIKQGKLINVKRKKPPGRQPFIKKVKK